MATQISIVARAIVNIYTRQIYKMSPLSGSNTNCSKLDVYEIPSDLAFKKITLKNLLFTSFSSYYDYPFTCKVYVVDNTLENILPGVGQYASLDDLNVITKSSHTFDYEFEINQGQMYLSNIPLYIGTGKYLVIELNSKDLRWWKNEDFCIYQRNVSWSDLLVYDEADYNQIVPQYPVDINIKQTVDTVFVWMNEADVDPVYFGNNTYHLPCVSHTVEYKKVGEIASDSLTVADGNYYQSVPANTFDVDKYKYRIKFESLDDYILYTDWKDFNVIGADAAPTITAVGNNPLTYVEWTASNQAAYELYIKDSEQKIIYKTDTVLSSLQFARINKFLPDGTYYVFVRIMNIYGLYSDWGTKAFFIQTSGAPTISDFVATVNNKYGVELTGTTTAFNRSTYVMRRKQGSEKIDIIGICYNDSGYIDYTAEGNTVYEYALRAYSGDLPGEAYRDSAWIPIEVKIKQVILQDSRDLENFIELYMSEDVDFNLRYSDERDRTLYNCLGRTYPVKESGEWINSVRSFTAYVTDEGFKKLVDIVLNAPFAYFKGTGEYFACDLTIADQGPYAGGGRLVEFTLTRISDDSNKLEIEG